MQHKQLGLLFIEPPCIRTREDVIQAYNLYKFMTGKEAMSIYKLFETELEGTSTCNILYYSAKKITKSRGPAY